MNSLILTAPILPGQLDGWKRWIETKLHERRDEYEAALIAGTLSRIRVWHQRGPEGADSAVVLFEGREPAQFLGKIAVGEDDFSTWFRNHLAKAHGFDLSVPPPPPPELLIDVSPAA
jgi:hypothetical protein